MPAREQAVLGVEAGSPGLKSFYKGPTLVLLGLRSLKAIMASFCTVSSLCLRPCGYRASFCICLPRCLSS